MRHRTLAVLGFSWVGALALAAQSPLDWDTFLLLFEDSPSGHMALYQGLAERPPPEGVWTLELQAGGRTDRPESLLERTLPRIALGRATLGYQHPGLRFSLNGGAALEVPIAWDRMPDYQVGLELGIPLYWRSTARDRWKTRLGEWQRRRARLEWQQEALDWYGRWLESAHQRESARRRLELRLRKAEAIESLVKAELVPRSQRDEAWAELEEASRQFEEASRAWSVLVQQLSLALGFEAGHHQPVVRLLRLELPAEVLLPEVAEREDYRETLDSLHESLAPALRVQVGLERQGETLVADAFLGVQWKLGVSTEREHHRMRYLEERVRLAELQWAQIRQEYFSARERHSLLSDSLAQSLARRRAQLAELMRLDLTADVVIERRWDLEEKILDLEERLLANDRGFFLYQLRLWVLRDSVREL